MRETLRGLLAACTGAALVASLSNPPCVAAAPLPGVVLGTLSAPAGSSASGWSVLVLSPQGELVARAAVQPRGEYRVEGVPEGRYALAAQGPDGRYAPVVGAPAAVTAGAETRRDIRLIPDTGGGALAQTVFGPRGDSWWSRQTRNQKIWSLVGIALGTGLVIALVDDWLDDDEAPASPYR